MMMRCKLLVKATDETLLVDVHIHVILLFSEISKRVNNYTCYNLHHHNCQEYVVKVIPKEPRGIILASSRWIGSWVYIPSDSSISLKSPVNCEEYAVKQVCTIVIFVVIWEEQEAQQPRNVLQNYEENPSQSKLPSWLVNRVAYALQGWKPSLCYSLINAF